MSFHDEHNDNNMSGSCVGLGFDQFKMFHIVSRSDICICRRHAKVVKIWSTQASLPFTQVDEGESIQDEHVNVSVYEMKAAKQLEDPRGIWSPLEERKSAHETM